MRKVLLVLILVTCWSGVAEAKQDAYLRRSKAPLSVLMDVGGFTDLLPLQDAWLSAREMERQASIVALWQPLAVCEQAGDWTVQGARFSGGLGFANTTWDAFGGREFAPNAGLASPYQQTIIATRVRDAVGPSAWDGCARRVPH